MTGSITQALENWKAGDEGSAFELERCLRAELLTLVRSRTNPQLKARIDSEGIVNAAMKSFLSGIRKSEFDVLKDRNDARKILTHFAICVLKDEIAFATRGKRDVRLETPEAHEVATRLDGSRELAPHEGLEAIEYFEKFEEVVRETHPAAIQVLELSLEGLSPVQIASEVGLAVRTVQVIIRKMIERWEHWLEASNGHT